MEVSSGDPGQSSASTQRRESASASRDASSSRWREPEAEATKKPGLVYTFYSYKGGVGRSMALANVAALLAKWGRRVLVVDWDLEAPGLERYFLGAHSDLDAQAVARAP